MIRYLFLQKGVLLAKDTFFNARAPVLGAVISALGYCQPGNAGCSTESVDEFVSVQTIVDGDTIRLTNDTLVRLIGINTPEIGYGNKVSEPLANSARLLLANLLEPHQRIGLVYGQDSEDKHGRKLAHAFVRKSGTFQNAQQLLLENGLAFWVAIPPNTQYLDCYRSAERAAQQKAMGIWREAYFQPKRAGIDILAPGFQLLQGKIVSAYKTKKSYWLKFNDTAALRIADNDIHNFQASRLEALNGKIVTARGWVYKRKNRFIMQIKHPASIELLARTAS